MKFKYHKSYKGFYLLEEGKFKRPYQKLDQEQTAAKLGEVVDFKIDEIIEIADDAVVFFEKEAKKNSTKQETKKEATKKQKEVDFKKLELKYKVPSLLLESLYSIISEDSKNPERELRSVLSVVQNIIYTDGLFSTKVQKIFYYNENALSLILSRYNLDKVNVAKLKKEIELNYPSQYISALPVDYKEYEMIFVFYFIILVELLAVLK